jgi:hypothetical protein
MHKEGGRRYREKKRKKTKEKNKEKNIGEKQGR